jgi:hypothetical protein
MNDILTINYNHYLVNLVVNIIEKSIITIPTRTNKNQQDDNEFLITQHELDNETTVEEEEKLVVCLV